MEVYAPDSFDDLENDGSEYGSDRDLFENDDLNDLCESEDDEPHSPSFTAASGAQGIAKTNPSRCLFPPAVESGTHRQPLRNATNTDTPTHSSETGLILEELKKVTSCLHNFSERLESLDSRLKSVEEMQVRSNSATPSSSSTDGSAAKGERKVPAKVSSTVRDVYKALLEEDDDFLGYDPKKRFSDKYNQDVVSRLVSEASKLDIQVPLIQLRDAAQRFYQTISETTALKDKGKYNAKVTQQRRKNRITRKLESRNSALMNSSSVSDAQREALKKVMLRAFMSSEESGEKCAEGESEKRPVLLVKTLPWRAKKLGRIFKQLDRKAARKKTKQSRQQTLPRVVGPESSRQRPTGFADDFFGFSD